MAERLCVDGGFLDCAHWVRTFAVTRFVKSIWASVEGSPGFLRRLNGWLTLFWIAMIPISIAMGWLTSVAYVSALSLWALVSGHWAAWQAARVECEQQREAEEAQADPLEDRVVRKILEQTTVTPAAIHRTPRAARRLQAEPNGDNGTVR
jgi:hypothetical protein